MESHSLCCDLDKNRLNSATDSGFRALHGLLASMQGAKELGDRDYDCVEELPTQEANVSTQIHRLILA